MNNQTYKLNKIDLNKLTIVFSWDDNFLNHYNIIADIFKKHNVRCTFYICIGQTDFTEEMKHNYNLLLNDGFEIGDHLYLHESAPNIDFAYFEELLKSSKEKWLEVFNKDISTFAFPYHDVNEQTFNRVLESYLETRNTINNTKLISLDTKSNIDDTIKVIEELAVESKNIMFAGHSIVPTGEYEKFNVEEVGYEPVSIEFLNNILKYINQNKSYQILTTEQSALKEYILKSSKYDKETVYFNNENIEHLKSKGVDTNNLQNLI